MSLTTPLAPTSSSRRGRPRKDAPEPQAEATPAEPPSSVQTAEVDNAVQTAEVATVKVRHGMPVYIASQSKLLLPNNTYPVIVDRWVRHQLSLRNGAVVKV